jgi:hypothetical protein
MKRIIGLLMFILPLIALTGYITIEVLGWHGLAMDLTAIGVGFYIFVSMILTMEDFL